MFYNCCNSLNGSMAIRGRSTIVDKEGIVSKSAVKQYLAQIGRKGGLKRAVNPNRSELARAAGLASQTLEVKAKRGLTIAKRRNEDR